MFKAINGNYLSYGESKPRTSQNRLNRKCQICGNAFLASSRQSRSCEFCKTPFHSLVAGSNLLEAVS
jgi:hypothetical protein